MERNWTRLKAIRCTVSCGFSACFKSWGNSVVSIIWLLTAWVMLVPFLNWAVWKAVWTGPVNQCSESGACWVYVTDNAYYLMYGLYPKTQIWRVNILLLLMGVWLWGVCNTRSIRLLIGLWMGMVLLVPIGSYWFIQGGILGLERVTAQYWGGLAFNMIFSTLSIACAFPLGCLLAVVRKNKWGVYSVCVRVIIDCIRGLPLVSLLFFASLVLPFFFSTHEESSKILRLYCMFTLFGSAYMAEAIRGGLQSVSKGQIEAAAVLGLSNRQTFINVVFPQSIEVALPSLINIVIALFKDSTLLSTIAVLDIVGMMQATTARMEWMPYAVEGYVMVGLIFWCLCSMIGIIGRRIEKSIAILK